MNQRHPSHRNTGIMSLPAGRAVQRFQTGGGGFSWGGAFNYVRGLISEAVPHIASSLVTVGLPALILGASPKDALKYSAAVGIGSLGAQKFNKLWGAGQTGQTGQTGGATPAITGPATPQEIADMEAAKIVPSGPLGYGPEGGTGHEYSPDQVQAFRQGLTPMTGSAGADAIDRRGVIESLWDVATEDDKLGSLKQAFLPDTRAFTDKVDYLRQYGPLLGLGIGGLWASGQFDPPDPIDPPDPWNGQTSQGLMRANPSAYRSAPTFVARGQSGGLAQSYPRRNGSINGPGTGTSDEIPAMLSDGEFVMTADAVRGAGNGSRKHGMQRMYDMMQTLEGAA